MCCQFAVAQNSQTLFLGDQQRAVGEYGKRFRLPQSLGENRLDVESVDFPSVKDISVTRSGATTWTIRANYEETAPLFANLSILVVFDKSVELQ